MIVWSRSVVEYPLELVQMLLTQKLEIQKQEALCHILKRPKVR